MANPCYIWILLCASEGVLGLFQLEPLNATVLHGSDVQFHATVQGNWQVMTWFVADLLVLTVPTNGSISSSSEQFSATFCSGGDTSCVEFTIHNATRGESGLIICSVQGDYGSKMAQLYVQESGTVNIPGGNVTVVQDQQVEFLCQTSAWSPIPDVSWTQNGLAVDSSLFNTTNVAHGDSFNSTSILRFPAVSDTVLTCLATVPALANPQSSSVFLTVAPKPPDWTVLIAVVVSFGGFALLVLLIIGLIFCYKRRKGKQPNYQEEMTRRVRTQSQLSGVGPVGLRQVHINAGYVTDSQRSIPPSELNDSGFSQIAISNIFEVPDVVNSNQTGDVYSSMYYNLDESGFRKHRHVTIV